ncbi:hypothetical protein SKAU_G00352290 [Synaphobranchus kaupii]|uniref:Uncharacterized protein n=1 Tax=Synaphobranchus kaupii TaxID=118154 RepID=A0A9Q1EKQ4_SYNKA|nr:hypothetical protein SKAU_G00352290 [Synaphobranchus kaupii]
MDFDIAKFVEDPTVEVLESCRKADLLQIADYFQIDVVRSGTRQAIKTRLNEALLEIEVLPACMVPKESTLIDSEESPFKSDRPEIILQGGGGNASRLLRDPEQWML